MVKLSKEEKEWRIESDAETLIRANEIQADAKRKKAALLKIKEKAKEAESAAKKLKSMTVAKKSTKKKKTTKRRKK